MKRSLKIYIPLFVCLMALLIVIGCAKKETTLTLVWAEWDPANFLVELAKDFTEETGIKVVVDPIPWGQFETKVFTAFAAKSDTYDIVIGDSQWLGRGAEGGHYVELTEWMKTTGLDKSMSPKALKYLGEYPKESGKYYAVPAETDCNGFAYRRDLFEDPKEMEDFKEKYGYDLAVPETYTQMKNIAEFFHRPDAEPPLYGIAMWLGKDYDAITMGFQQVMWSFGGSYGDPKTYKVDGILNSDEGVKALEFYVDLAKFTPPGSENYYWNECLTAFQQGKVSMAMDFFAFFPGLLAEDKSPYADSTGFFAAPGQVGEDGEFRRYISMGGQGMSISSYSKNKEAAKQFINWFCKPKNQLKWAKLGGLAASSQVLESEEFLKMNPFNPAFVESLKYVRDFWAVPEYAELLQRCQTNWNAAVTGQMTAKEAMDKLAKEHEEIFRNAGYYDK
ncbi:extracellular solute-binding protein [Candidatus Poribacteria bacterium]|nr:extracellular solute-binding protein [Candidatus Poribacteria bacterium]